MDPIVVLVVVVALLIGVGVALRHRRVGRAVNTSAKMCVFCLRPIVGTDHIAAMKENAVRELLGRVPTAHPPTTDPLGNRRWLGHADCAAEAGADLRAAGKVADAPPPPSTDPKELICPACGHRFRRPDIVISTEDFARRYGTDAEQCPRCDHVWNTGRPPRYTIRG